MDSFYGGQPGAPFFIAEEFNTFEELETCFLDISYRNVKYGEYAIISNKSSSENGDLYRRDPSGPHYIANISGPYGGAIPNVHFCSLGELSIIFDKLKNGSQDFSYIIYPEVVEEDDNNFYTSGTTPYKIKIVSKEAISSEEFKPKTGIDCLKSSFFERPIERLIDNEEIFTVYDDSKNNKNYLNWTDTVRMGWLTIVKTNNDQSIKQNNTSGDTSNNGLSTAQDMISSSLENVITFIGIQIPTEFNNFKVNYTTPSLLLDDNYENIRLNTAASSDNLFYKEWQIDLPLYNNFSYRNLRLSSCADVKRLFQGENPTFKLYEKDIRENDTTRVTIDTINFENKNPSDYLWIYNNNRLVPIDKLTDICSHSIDEQNNDSVPRANEENTQNKNEGNSQESGNTTTEENSSNSTTTGHFCLLCEYDYFNEEDYWLNYVERQNLTEMQWEYDQDTRDKATITVLVGVFNDSGASIAVEPTAYSVAVREEINSWWG